MVDVGGGIGAISIQLAKAFSNLKLVVQDRAPIVEDGQKVRDKLTFASPLL